MQQYQNQIFKAIIDSLLPRLSHVDFNAESQGTIPTASTHDDLSRLDVIDLTNLCMLASDRSLEKLVCECLESDYSLDYVFEQVLGPIARELGDRWLRDEISFVDVHLGVLKLSSIADAAQAMLPVEEFDTSPSAALAATPGDQHTLGVALAAKALTQRGWQVSNFTGFAFEEWLISVRRGTFDLVGLSLYVDAGFDTLCEAINQLKSDSETESMLVTVTGDFFVRNPNQIVRCGADAYVSTIEETCQLMSAHLAKDAQNVTPTEFFA